MAQADMPTAFLSDDDDDSDDELWHPGPCRPTGACQPIVQSALRSPLAAATTSPAQPAMLPNKHVSGAILSARSDLLDAPTAHVVYDAVDRLVEMHHFQVKPVSGDCVSSDTCGQAARLRERVQDELLAAGCGSGCFAL
jgi:hypothetical protein